MAHSGMAQIILVWIAIEQDWESQETLGIFYSKEAAERKCREVQLAWRPQYKGQTPYGYRVEGPYEVQHDGA